MEKITISTILQFFDNKGLDAQSLAYLRFHQYRYLYILQNIAQARSQLSSHQSLHLLDIGPAFQTELIRHFFPDMTINTMGFEHPASIRRPHERHFPFDLNQADKNTPTETITHHIILFSEVIEHLYTKPEIVINYLNYFIHQGGFMIIQTPNAVAIHKRVLLAIGKNPYNLIEENKMGHYREYTRRELKTILRNTGYSITKIHSQNYFNPDQTFFQRLYRQLNPILPPAWRDGITIVGKKA